MNKNILGLGYEALLQPDVAPRKTECNNAAPSAEALRAAKIKFFGLDRLFQPGQKVK